MYAKVIIDSKSRFLNRPFTYHIPEKLNNKLKRAMRVLVPFGKGNNTSVAFVYEIVETIDFEYDTKDIITIIDENKLVSDELLNLAFFMTREYLSPIQLSLKQVLPPTSIDKIKTFYISNVQKDDNLFDFLKIRRTKEEIQEKFQISSEKLNNYIEDKEIKVIYEANDRLKISYDTNIRLLNNEYKVPKNAIKQKIIIDYLQKYGITKKEILLKNTKSSLSSLK